MGFAMDVLRGAGGASMLCAACGAATLVSSLASEQRFRGDGLERMHDIKTLYRYVIRITE